MKKVRDWFLDVLKGITIGFAAMIPGVSGGTMAVLTKCYDKLVGSVSTLFKNFVKSFLILLPLGIGVVIGAATGFIALRVALNSILFTIVSIFFGLILGSVPSIAKEVKGEKVQPKHIVAFAIAFVFVVGIALASFLISLGTGYSVESLFVEPKWWLFLVMIPLGFIGSVALVAPGISGSMILLILGFYQPLFDTIHAVLHFENVGQNIGLLACFIVGLIAGFFFVSKLMKMLLEKHRTITYWVILGFIIGSLPSLYLNAEIYVGKVDEYVGIGNQLIEIPFGIVLLIGAAVGTFFILRYVDTKDNDNAEVEKSE